MSSESISGGTPASQRIPPIISIKVVNGDKPFNCPLCGARHDFNAKKNECTDAAWVNDATSYRVFCPNMKAPGLVWVLNEEIRWRQLMLQLTGKDDFE
jgi:hypothetical protein